MHDYYFEPLFNGIKCPDCQTRFRSQKKIFAHRKEEKETLLAEEERKEKEFKGDHHNQNIRHQFPSQSNLDECGYKLLLRSQTQLQ